jgi:ElaB/YqjD/DUF883 family membrane-anchored ribosome-binding protein
MANGSFESSGSSPYSSRLEDTASAVSREGQRLTDRAREGVEQATGYVRDAMDRTREKVSEYRDTGIERVKEDVVSYTREQPLTALLIAGAVGLLIGWMSMMGGRRSGGLGLHD